MSGALAAAVAAAYTPPAGGGGSVAFDVANKVEGESLTTGTTTSTTVAGTSNRFAIGGALIGDAQTISSATLFGGAATLLGSGMETAAYSGFVASRSFERVAPSSGSQTASATASAETNPFCLVGAVYNGVNQSTPKNSTATPTNGTFEDPVLSGGASITVTTVAGGKAVALLYILGLGGGHPTITPGTGVTVRQQADSLYGTIVLLERDHVSGGSTAVACTITFDDEFLCAWYMQGWGIQP